MNITIQNLKDVKIGASLQQDVLNAFNNNCEKYKVNTRLRIAHFMAQVCHESGGFTIKSENLKYTNPHRLMTIWPSRFKTLEFAKQYINNPAKLANYVYANRMGNGNTESGEGYKYRGRGPMQTTGKESYAAISKKIFNDKNILINDPDKLLDLNFGILAAFIEWNDGNCNALADADDIKSITKHINGGLIGLQERKLWLADWKHTL
jgi:putative chitinase